MLNLISTGITMLGGPKACVIIALCFATIILNLYSRDRNARAAALWLESTKATWFNNFKQLRIRKRGNCISMIPDGPLVSRLFATGRENLRHVCAELQPMEYTLTLQATITRKDIHGPILLGVFPNETAGSLKESNWALSRLAKPVTVKGISDDKYTVIAETRNFLSRIVEDLSINTFFNLSRGKDKKGANLPIDEALLQPVIKYLVISDSFHEPPPNAEAIFADVITVTLKTAIPSPHNNSPMVRDAYEANLSFFLDIVDYLRAYTTLPQKLHADVIQLRRAASESPAQKPPEPEDEKDAGASSRRKDRADRLGSSQKVKVRMRNIGDAKKLAGSIRG